MDPGRVLITGANGHLGRRLIQRLAASGVPLRAVVRSERAATTLRELPEQPDTRILDYADADALTGAARDCQAAVHLVGIIKESATSRFEVAHEGTSRALALAAERAGLRRIVYLSIVGSRPDASNACLASKGRAEQILLAAKTPAVVLRVPMVIGPGDWASFALRKQAQSGVVPLLRGGASREQPIDAEDVVSAMIAATTRDGLDDVALDLAGPESITRRELLTRCAALYGKNPSVVPIPRSLMLSAAFAMEKLSGNPPLSRAMVGVLDHDDDVDTTEACARLGIELTPLDETLRRCVGPGSETA